MNPLCGNLVANSPICVYKVIKCIIGLCLNLLSVVYMCIYIDIHVYESDI
jgi:hypothetical protein